MGGEGGEKGILGSSSLPGGPRGVDGELAACPPPSFPSLYWGEKRLFACLRGLGMPVPIEASLGRDVPCGSAQHPLTREAQTWGAGVEMLHDQQVLVVLDQFGRGKDLVIDWKARGEGGPPLASVSPCRGSARAEPAARRGLLTPLTVGDPSQWGPVCGKLSPSVAGML